MQALSPISVYDPKGQGAGAADVVAQEKPAGHAKHTTEPGRAYCEFPLPVQGTGLT